MKRNCWLKDRSTQHPKRFHQNEKSWLRYPKGFIDSGRPFLNEYLFPKSRGYHVSRDVQDEWIMVRTSGWGEVAPQWVAGADV